MTRNCNQCDTEVSRREFLSAGALSLGGLAVTDNSLSGEAPDGKSMQTPFASQMYEAGANCTPWPLSVLPFRLNRAYIAPPRPGENRDEWLKAIRAYRHALRTGKDDFGLRFHPGSFDRRYFTGSTFDAAATMLLPVAMAYDFRPGEKVPVVADLRMMEGEGLLRIGFEIRDRAGGTPASGAKPSEHPVAIPPNRWQTLHFDVVVPEFNHQKYVAVPHITFKGAGKTELPQLDIRSLIFDVGDQARMRKASEACAATPDCKKGIDLSSYDRPDLKWASRC